MNEKQKNNRKKLMHNILIFGLILIICPILAIFLLYTLINVHNQNNVSIMQFLEENQKDIMNLTFGFFILAIFMITQFMSTAKSKQKNILANSKFASLDEQKQNLKIAKIDSSPIEISGCPINKISDNEILYDPSPVHTLCVGTTASGKSRKHVRQTVFLSMKAKESMVFNDCKKEFYYDFKNILEEQGYNIKLIEFRNFEFSDCWNPMQIINDAVKENRLDDADEYTNDLVNALVKESKGEPIWENGEKSVLKAIILLIATADIDDSQKNLFSVAQVLSILGKSERKFRTKKTMEIDKILNLQMTNLDEVFNSLPENHIARVAYGTASVSAEATKASFFASAQSTLAIFASLNVARVLSKNDLDLNDLVCGKNPTALFIVNPDEKTTYNQIASILFSQIYTIACKEANKLSGCKLPRKLNMIFDEFGNMPKLNKFDGMISVARSRNIIFYLYVQDFVQMDSLYGKEIAETIRANCNIWIFIASSNTKTCKDFEEKIGFKDVLVESVGNNFSGMNQHGGNVNYSHQKVPLINFNDLMTYDNRDGERIIVCKTYMNPIIACLPDITKYAWNNLIKQISLDEENLRIENKQFGDINFAIPRSCMFPVSETEGISFFYWSNQDCNDFINDLLNEKINNESNEENEFGLDELLNYIKIDLPEQINNYCNVNKEQTEQPKQLQNIDILKNKYNEFFD